MPMDMMDITPGKISFDPGMPPGTHTIKIKATGYQDATVVQEIEMGGMPPQTLPLSVTNVTANSATLTWDNSVDHYNDIRVFVNNNRPEVADLGDVGTYTLTGLSSNTQYSIKVEFRRGGDDFPRAVGTTTVTTN